MGVVYRAQDTLLERIVALKVISASIEENPQLRDRFFREARAAGQLSHPHIITIHDLGEHDGQPYLAMEYLTGQDLQRLLTAHAPMSLGRKLEVAAAICDGLAYAHRRGVVHRDIKPANIFITDDGGVKILDFGLARMVSSELTGSNMMLGTLNYMSPEQVRGERTDHRADIFSFGVVFYELVGGKKAFEGDSFATTIYKILQEVPEPLRNLDATLPQDVINIVDRTLAKTREERYQELTDVARDLAVFRSGITPHTAVSAIAVPQRPPSDPPMPLPVSAQRASSPPLSDPSAPTMLADAWRDSIAAQPRRGWNPLVAGGLVIVIGLAIAGWWATQRNENATPETTAPAAAPAQTAAPSPAPSAPVAAPPSPPQASTSPAVVDSNVEEARSRMTRSKEAARDAGSAAVNSPVFGAASAAEREGTRLLQAGRHAEAAVKFYEASGLFQSAELTARTTPSTRSARSGQAPPPQSGRSGREAEPPVTSPPAPSAPPKPAENPIPTPPVQSTPPGVIPQPTQPPLTLPPVTVQPPPSSPVKPPAPSQPEPVPADAGVRDLVRRYAQALEARSIDSLKRIWPSLSGVQEDALRKEFSHARQIDVQIGNVEVAPSSGSTASAVFLRRYELVTVDGQRLLTNSRTFITARRSGEAWVIEQVRFEAIR